MDNTDHITLKWGTLKSWRLTSERGQELLKEYYKLGVSLSAMAQHDTPEQKKLICEMIDECNALEIYLDWVYDRCISKEDAKKYVMAYDAN
jgi:hypothetical protein